MIILVLSFIPLLLGYLFIYLLEAVPQLRLSGSRLGVIQVGFLLLASLALAFSVLGYNGTPVSILALTFLVAEAAHLLLVGFLSTQVPTASHGLFLYTVGLLPWLAGMEVVGLFLLLGGAALTIATYTAGGLSIASLKERKARGVKPFSQRFSALVLFAAVLITLAVNFFLLGVPL